MSDCRRIEKNNGVLSVQAELSFRQFRFVYLKRSDFQAIELMVE